MSINAVELELLIQEINHLTEIEKSVKKQLHDKKEELADYLRDTNQTSVENGTIRITVTPQLRTTVNEEKLAEWLQSNNLNTLLTLKMIPNMDLINGVYKDLIPNHIKSKYIKSTLYSKMTVKNKES